MACPDCGYPSGEFRFATSIETHGLDCGPFEKFDEEFVICGECGGKFDPCDWEEAEDLRSATIEDIDSLDEADNASGSEPEMPDSARSSSAAPF